MRHLIHRLHLGSAFLLAIILAAGVAAPRFASAEGRAIARIFEDAFARRILMETRPGKALLRQITGHTHVGETTYSSLMQRLAWEDAGSLHDELVTTIERLRGEAGRIAEIPLGERLVTEDLRRLEQLAAELRSNRVDGFVTEFLGFVHVPSPIRPLPARGARAPRSRTAAVAREAFLEGTEAPAGAARARAAATEESVAAAEAEPRIPGEDVPELPIPVIDGLRPDAINLREATLGWRRAIASWFRNRRNFFSALLSDGHWRAIYGRGPRYTTDQLVQIRRLNRLNDSLNAYAQMRIMVKSFARESPALYTELNQRTAESVQLFLEGRLDIEGLIAARTEAANALRLNEIIPATERRMLNAIQRLKELGGSVKAGEESRGLVDFAEENFVFYTQRVELLTARSEMNSGIRTSLSDLRRSLRGTPAQMRSAAEARVARLEPLIAADTTALEQARATLATRAAELERAMAAEASAGSTGAAASGPEAQAVARAEADLKTIGDRLAVNAGTAEKIRAALARPAGTPVRATLDGNISDLQRTVRRDLTERDLWFQRRAKEAADLQRFYLEFVEHYETLDIFVNLRRGRINSEAVRAFDMPEPFVVPGAQVQGWAPHYERALFNSTNELVVGETRLFFQTQIGRTRTFIRDMNKLTEKYFGKRFTQTETGREFVRYQRHIIHQMLRRVAVAAGVSVPPALAAYGDNIANWIEAVLNGEEPAPSEGGTPPPVGSGSSDPAPAPADEDPTPRPSRGDRGDSRPRRTPAPSPEPAREPAPAPGPVDTGEPAPPNAPGDLFPDLGGSN